MPKQKEEEKFETWAIVELMGHRKIVGRISEEIRFGTVFCRIDVPEVPHGYGENAHGTIPAFTQYYGGSSIYCLTPVSENIARLIAQKDQQRPVQPWDIPNLPQIPVRIPTQTEFLLGEQPEDEDEDPH